jgi:hypothetical protein
MNHPSVEDSGGFLLVRKLCRGGVIFGWGEFVTERLIHEDYMTRIALTLEEACNLFDAFHYYGKCNTLDLVEEMMTVDEPLPLINHWSSFDEFLNVWDFFYRASRELPRTFYGKMIVDCKIPDQMDLSKAQRELLSNQKEYLRQACYLLSFFDSMSDCFDYEVKMIEQGYPYRYRPSVKLGQ